MRPTDLPQPLATLMVATCNVLNLANPGRMFYDNQDPYSAAEFERKITWLGERFRMLNADVLAVQEVWDDTAFKDAVLASGLRYDTHTVKATPLGGTSELERQFDNVSASIAGFLRPAPGLFLGLSLAHNERAPSEVELFADGLHIATAAYETGDTGLRTEKVNTLEGTVHYDAGKVSADLHVYASKYDGFIDERPTGATFTADGEDFPVFQFVQTDATFYGFEAEGAYALWEQGTRKLALEGAVDYVHAETDLGPAARIPPWSATARLAWTSTPFDASVEVRHVAEQDRVADLELPTNDYTLLNLAAAWRPLADRNVTVFAEAKNLTDEEAREHVSFLKDIAPMPGRNFRVGVAYRF